MAGLVGPMAILLPLRMWRAMLPEIAFEERPT